MNDSSSGRDRDAERWREAPDFSGSHRRARWLVSCLGVAWLLVAARLWQLQVWEQKTLVHRAAIQRETIEEVHPRPGDIYDRHGRVLATTVRCRSLFLVPTHIAKPWWISQQLAEALNLDSDDLFARIGRHSDKHFLWIKRRLSEEEAERVRALQLPAECWGFREEYRRVYPQGALATQVLGLRDIDGYGRGGIEERYDSILRGTPGRRRLTRDALGRVIEVTEDPDHPPLPGESLVLTLDTVVQLFVERELDRLVAAWQPESCCAVVLEPQTGEVLAMASRPTFDPNRPETASADAWKNRVIADIYEPGSTFKPLIVAYGLEHRLLDSQERFDCEWGLYRMGRRLLHDHHPYGTLSLTDVLVKSSNIGMAKVGERMGNEHLYAAARAFGFGRKSGIDLPGEQPGILRPLSEWTSYSTGSIPMGHELAATPLQLIVAHAALANGGKLLQPRILSSRPDVLSDLRGDETQVVHPHVARWMVEGPLREVVSRGTGRKAQLAGYSVFGKTGTAQALSSEGGYQHGRYISSFVCGGPVEDPRALVLVVVNQAGRGTEAFGGKVAAPAAAEILRQTLLYLRVAPSETASPARVAQPTLRGSYPR